MDTKEISRGKYISLISPRKYATEIDQHNTYNVRRSLCRKIFYCWICFLENLRNIEQP